MAITRLIPNMAMLKLPTQIGRKGTQALLFNRKFKKIPIHMGDLILIFLSRGIVAMVRVLTSLKSLATSQKSPLEALGPVTNEVFDMAAIRKKRGGDPSGRDSHNHTNHI